MSPILHSYIDINADTFIYHIANNDYQEDGDERLPIIISTWICNLVVSKALDIPGSSLVQLSHWSDKDLNNIAFLWGPMSPYLSRIETGDYFPYTIPFAVISLGFQVETIEKG